ncbi:hypothetical protein NXW38_08855 [Bacteroides ovatus]|nr:hypothetical protein [Bacteroides ovatus]
MGTSESISILYTPLPPVAISSSRSLRGVIRLTYHIPQRTACGHSVYKYALPEGSHEQFLRTGVVVEFADRRPDAVRVRKRLKDTVPFPYRKKSVHGTDEKVCTVRLADSGYITS